VTKGLKKIENFIKSYQINLINW